VMTPSALFSAFLDGRRDVSDFGAGTLNQFLIPPFLLNVSEGPPDRFRGFFCLFVSPEVFLSPTPGGFFSQSARKNFDAFFFPIPAVHSPVN